VDKAVDSLSQLIKGLAEHKTDISNTVAYTNSSSAPSPIYWPKTRPPFKDAVAQTDRVSSIVVADHDYVDNLLNTLPDSFKTLGRLGLYATTSRSTCATSF